MENTVQCPVHGEKLEIGPKIITFMGMHYNALEGRCPKCRMVYLDQKIKGIARFTYEGANYQYLPELESWRIEQERKQEEEKKQKRLEQQKLEQKRRRQEELRKKEEKLKAALPETIYVIRNIDVKVCPICDKRGAMIPKALTIQSGKDGLRDTTIIGYSCGKCHAVFVPEKTAEKDFLERYIEYLSLDYLTTELQEKKLKQKKLEEKFPFIVKQNIEVRIGKYIQNRCPVHKKHLKELGWVMTRAKSEPERLLYGCYCQNCNIVYMASNEREKIQQFIRIYGKSATPFKMLPAELQQSKAKPVQVSFMETGVIKSELQSIDTPKAKYVEEKQRYEVSGWKSSEQEIVTISAQIGGNEKLIHVFPTIKENEKKYLKSNGIYVRESESLGRELLGRIAYNRLDEFTSKIGTIKIHNYKVWPGQEYHLDGFTKFCNPDEIQDITIMSQKNLDRDSEEYEMVTALVYCANREEPVYIDVYYSQQQNRYFINDESYRLYRTRYGLPYVHLVPGQYDGDMDYGNLRQYSELNLYGYTVAKAADMTSGERQQLLQQLMDNGLMSKHQIVNHLEWLIHRQSGRISMEDACDCWKEDLRFVNNYRIQNQRKIRGHFVYGTKTLKH